MIVHMARYPKSTCIFIHTHALDIVIMPSCFPRLSGRGSGSRSGHSGRSAVLCCRGSADSSLGLVEKQKVLIDWQVFIVMQH